MRYRYTILLLAIGLVAGLAGCAGSPGRNATANCDPCDTIGGLEKLGKANVAAAEGGLSQELAPVMGDKVPFKPLVGFGSGAGDTDVSDGSTNNRRQVTSGNQNNGMFNFVPTAARAGDGTGSTPLVVGLSQSLRCVNWNLRVAVKNKDGEAYERFATERQGILDRMETAEARAASGSTSLKVNFKEAKNQNLANAKATADGEGPSDAAAKAGAEMFKAGTKAVIKGSENITAEYESEPEKKSDADPEADADVPPAGPGGETDGE